MKMKKIIEDLQKLAAGTRDTLNDFDRKHEKPWDETKKDNDENFTPEDEKLRQYYFGLIHGLEIAIEKIKEE